MYIKNIFKKYSKFLKQPIALLGESRQITLVKNLSGAATIFQII